MLRHVLAAHACPPLISDFRWLPTTPSSPLNNVPIRAVVEYCEKAVVPATAFPRRLREYLPKSAASLLFTSAMADVAILSKVAFR